MFSHCVLLTNIIGKINLLALDIGNHIQDRHALNIYVRVSYMKLTCILGLRFKCMFKYNV